MSRQFHVGTVICSVGLAVIVGTAAIRAQEKELTTGQSKVERLVAVDLAEVGLPGNSVAQRVTIDVGIKTADHSHSGRSALLVMIQGSLTEVRGTVKNVYKPGDVVHVPEGATHHAENYGTVPIVYIEINTTSKKQ